MKDIIFEKSKLFKFKLVRQLYKVFWGKYVGMFDYKKFEEDLVVQLKKALQQLKKLREDIYFLSLACAEDCTKVAIYAATKHHFEILAPKGQSDYFSYKYCENEWEIGFIPSNIFDYMYDYMKKNNFYRDDGDIDACFYHFDSLK